MQKCSWTAAIFAGLMLSPLATHHVNASNYPERLIRFIVSAPAGTAPDIIARIVAPKISEDLGQQIIVENKAGANGNLAASEVAKSPPDGYTFLLTVAGTVTANPFLYPKTSVTDLQPLSQIGTVDFTVSVRPSLKVETFNDLLALIRRHPGKINGATTANGSFPHLAAEMLKRDADLDFLIVKHNGGAAAGTSVAGEHTDFVIETRAVLLSLIQGGKLKPLATTGSSRSPVTPDLPTVAEAGVVDYSIVGWVGILAPKGTPSKILNRVHRALAKAMTDGDIRKRIVGLDFVPVGSSPAQFEATIAKERAQLSRLIKSINLQQE